MVFVASNDLINYFGQELERILNLKFAPVGESPEIYYRFTGENWWLEIGTHTFINDRDLDFENFSYLIEIGAYNVRSLEECSAVIEYYARYIFDELRALNKYRLMLTYGVQIKLDEFAPIDPSSDPI